jgi:hypothetical protein
MIDLIESIEEEEQPSTEKSKLQKQLVEMYQYVKLIETNSGIQARLPFLYWID